MHLDQILSHFQKIKFFVIFTCGTSQYRPRRIFCGCRNFYMTLEIGLVTSKVFPIQKGGLSRRIFGDSHTFVVWRGYAKIGIFRIFPKIT